MIRSGFWEKCRNLTGIKDGKGIPGRAEVQGQQRERWGKYQNRLRELGEGKWGSEHMDKAGKVRRGCRIDWKKGQIQVVMGITCPSQGKKFSLYSANVFTLSCKYSECRV